MYTGGSRESLYKDREIFRLNMLLCEVEHENSCLKERITYLEERHKILINKLDSVKSRK